MNQPAISTEIAVLSKRAIVVRTPDEYRECAALVADIKTKKQTIIDFFKDTKSKAHQTWKAICTQETGFLDKLNVIEKKAKTALDTYEKEEERKRREAETRLRAQEEERARIEREELQRKAEQLAAAGKAKEAANFQMQADAVQAVPISVPATTVPKVDTISYQYLWRVEVVDKAALIAAALAEPRLQVFLGVETRMLEIAATDRDGKLEIPGIRFFQEKIIKSKGS